MDIEGFLTRFKHYVNVTNPATLIYSEERILQAKAALQDGTSKDPQFDQKLVDAAVHPVTGEVIPKLFRVSAIAPVNIPLISAMLSCPASNVPGTLFLHWINQSYNTACNYANRSGSDQSVDQLLKAYGLAVTSACSLAYGLGKVIEHGPPILRTSGAIIPCIATAAANCSNIGFTRMNEITSGTTVFDKYGKEHGISAVAGKQCVTQTALTRCVLVPVSCLMLPPFIMNRLQKLRMLPMHPRLKFLIELGVIYFSIQVALPAALAVYPQTASFPVQSLEAQFHGLRHDDGSPIETLFANKGL